MTVGYNIDLGCFGEPTVCVDCAAQYDEPCFEIDEATAVELNLQCSDCGRQLVDPSTYWDDDLPDACPNCGADQYFLEIMDNDQVECGRCGWHNDKPTFEEWSKSNV
jgi:ribosomal protein S27AE